MSYETKDKVDSKTSISNKDSGSADPNVANKLLPLFKEIRLGYTDRAELAEQLSNILHISEDAVLSELELNVFLIKTTYKRYSCLCAKSDITLVAFGLLDGYYYHNMPINQRRKKYILETEEGISPEDRDALSADVLGEDNDKKISEKLSNILSRFTKREDKHFKEIADYLYDHIDDITVKLVDESKKYVTEWTRFKKYYPRVCDDYVQTPYYILKRGKTQLKPLTAEAASGDDFQKYRKDPEKAYPLSPGYTITDILSKPIVIDDITVRNLTLKKYSKDHSLDKNNRSKNTVNTLSKMAPLFICAIFLGAFFLYVKNTFSIPRVNENVFNRGSIPSAEISIPLNGAFKLPDYSEVDRNNSIGYGITEHPELINLSQEGWITFKNQNHANVGETAQILVFVNNIVQQEFTFIATEPQDTGDAILGSDLDDYAPSFRIEQKVRVIGGVKEWTDYVEAEIGDIIEFQMEYQNKSVTGEIQNDVGVRDILPSNLEYIPNTAKLWNTAYDGDLISPDTSLFGNGITIGNYVPGAGAYVRFRAKVVDQDLGVGTNTLVNWSQCGVGKITIQDYASVIVTKEKEA